MLDTARSNNGTGMNFHQKKIEVEIHQFRMPYNKLFRLMIKTTFLRFKFSLMCLWHYFTHIKMLKKPYFQNKTMKPYIVYYENENIRVFMCGKGVSYIAYISHNMSRMLLFVEYLPRSSIAIPLSSTLHTELWDSTSVYCCWCRWDNCSHQYFLKCSSSASFNSVQLLFLKLTNVHTHIQALAHTDHFITFSFAAAYSSVLFSARVQVCTCICGCVCVCVCLPSKLRDIFVLSKAPYFTWSS